jgi:hypothetical protein
MKTRRHVPIAPGKIGAWVCLLAAMLLWAPLWSSAWQTKGMACCDGRMCVAHGHAAGQHTPMNCGHEGHAGVAACQVKCCQDEGATFVAAVIFLMPGQIRIFAPVVTQDVREKAQAVLTAFVVEPPYPPPRSIASIA